MQKLRHNFVVFGLIICFAFINPILPCNAVIPVVQDSQENMMVDDGTNVKDLDIDPINTDKVKKSVVPDTKSEIRKVINLFLKTMFFVAFSVIVLYVIILFIKKYYGSAFSTPADENEYDNLELSTPEDKTSALKSFLNRTKY